jgi:adenosylcobinamide kinase / adenosylcobinamide-phosphate guanylyltransferase
VIALVLGGSRSGKSELAERMVGDLPAPVTYVATMRSGDGDRDSDVDDDLAARIRRHAARRPTDWHTLEAGLDLARVLRATAGSVLLDSLGPWVAAHEGAAVNGAALCEALRERPGDTVVVSEEVGLGVHPSSEAGRHFRDALGLLNQEVAAVSDQVWLVVAGRALQLGEMP